MTELHPSDHTLLSLTHDAETGIEYIPTGLTPYHLAFRRLVHRLLIASRRANDLRVYQDGTLSVGIRPGRCFIRGASQVFAGVTNQPVTADASIYFWLDAQGEVQSSTAALPPDRTSIIPLALVQANESQIVQIIDLRAETLFHVPSPGSLRVTMPLQYIHAGPLDADHFNAIVGVMTRPGRVVDVALTLGTNLVTDDDDDRIECNANVNWEGITTAPASIRVAAGTGQRSTLAGDGQPAALDQTITDLEPGDLISVSLTRHIQGVLSVAPQDVIVSVTIQALD